MVAEFPVVQRIVEVLSDAPSPRRILEIRLTQSELSRFEELTSRNTDGGLTFLEKGELDAYLFADHLVGMAKAKAYGKSRNRS